MKHKKITSGIIALISLAVMNVAIAADYSSMSTEELVQMRSQIRDMSDEERNSFRNEMRSRVQSMSAEERARFQQANRQNSAKGSGAGYGGGNGLRQGGGYQ